MEHKPATIGYKLPPLVVSPTDVVRVRREVEALDTYLEGQRMREPGSPMARLPKTSRLLDDFVALNNLNLLHETVRHELRTYLQDLHDHAPRVHISFAAEPSAPALQKVVTWLRLNISPIVLVSVGLQPSIVAGCTLRTTNRYFDMSLHKYLRERRQFLVAALSERPAQSTPVIAETSEAVNG